MRTGKMLAALLAGLIILSLTGCDADKAENTSSDPATTKSGITATVTESTAEPTAESSLPAGTESTTKSPKSVDSTPTETAKPESAGPQFDINYWIEFARKYAENIGLAINPEAVSCWDNPIIAGPNSKYLERDIKTRMNRYKNVEGFTDIWVWAEPDENGNYRLFIGYA